MKTKFIHLSVLFFLFISCSNAQDLTYFKKYTYMNFALYSKAVMVNSDPVKFAKEGEFAHVFCTSTSVDKEINIAYVTDENFKVKYKIRYKELVKIDTNLWCMADIDNPNSNLYVMVDNDDFSISHLIGDKCIFYSKVDAESSGFYKVMFCDNKSNIHRKE